MKGCMSFVLLALVACGAGDDVADGARDLCAEGGELNDCRDVPRTPMEACWRLVDCGAIPLHREDPNADDWGNCVDEIERMRETSQRLTIACIAASTCDQLKLDDDRCFLFGRN
jgi:hypothetical protein